MELESHEGLFMSISNIAHRDQPARKSFPACGFLASGKLGQRLYSLTHGLRLGAAQCLPSIEADVQLDPDSQRIVLKLRRVGRNWGARRDQLGDLGSEINNQHAISHRAVSPSKIGLRRTYAKPS